MRKITVTAMLNAQEMESHLNSLANDTESDFRGALDLDVSHIDNRAEAYGVRITDVDMDATSISVSYEVDYSIYNGCKDMDIDDSEELFVSGVRTTDGWVFDESIPHPKRTTADEF